MHAPDLLLGSLRMGILLDGLFVLLGVVCGVPVGLPSLLLLAIGPWLAEAIGRRPGTPIARRRRNAVVLVTAIAVAHVVWMWFLAGWIVGRLGCVHPWELRIGATIGAIATGGMGWIFLCAALDQMIKEPEPSRVAEESGTGR